MEYVFVLSRTANAGLLRAYRDRLIARRDCGTGVTNLTSQRDHANDWRRCARDQGQARRPACPARCSGRTPGNALTVGGVAAPPALERQRTREVRHDRADLVVRRVARHYSRLQERPADRLRNRPSVAPFQTARSSRDRMPLRRRRDNPSTAIGKAPRRAASPFAGVCAACGLRRR